MRLLEDSLQVRTHLQDIKLTIEGPPEAVYLPLKKGSNEPILSRSEFGGSDFLCRVAGLPHE